MSAPLFCRTLCLAVGCTLYVCAAVLSRVMSSSLVGRHHLNSWSDPEALAVNMAAGLQ